LYGNNDGIKDNDLVSRNGVLINSNATMIDIHNQFGLTCFVASDEESLVRCYERRPSFIQILLL
jgi:hypothetical protein